MGCACKVNEKINKIYTQYGTIKPAAKTNIRGKINLFLGKILTLICIIFLFPIFFPYLILRKIFTNKPISIIRLIKRDKNVRI